MTESKRMLLTDLENWLFQTKKELLIDDSVDWDLSNVSIEINRVRVNHKTKRVFIVKVNDKNYKTLMWD